MDSLTKLAVTGLYLGILLGICFQNLCMVIGFGSALIATCITNNKA